MLHSKEDILQNINSETMPFVSGGMIYRYDALSAMDEYAKQECIRFAEWVKDNYMPYYNESDVSKCWVAIFNMSLVDIKLITSEQLYAEFINEQTK
jgi:hypothetical protein